jgi:hypothetical protein
MLCCCFGVVRGSVHFFQLSGLSIRFTTEWLIVLGVFGCSPFPCCQCRLWKACFVSVFTVLFLFSSVTLHIWRTCSNRMQWLPEWSGQGHAAGIWFFNIHSLCTCCCHCAFVLPRDATVVVARVLEQVPSRKLHAWGLRLVP